MELWEVELRRELGQNIEVVVEEEPVVRGPLITPQNSFFAYGIGIIVVVILIAFGVIWFFKFGPNSPVSNHQIAQLAPPAPSPHDYSADIAALRVELLKLGADDAQRMESFDRRLTSQHNKIVVLGIVSQENAARIQNGQGNSLMFLNADWTLDQMPRYLNITEADKEFLQKWVKPK